MVPRNDSCADWILAVPGKNADGRCWRKLEILLVIWIRILEQNLVRVDVIRSLVDISCPYARLFAARTDEELFVEAEFARDTKKAIFAPVCVS